MPKYERAECRKVLYQAAYKLWSCWSMVSSRTRFDKFVIEQARELFYSIFLVCLSFGVLTAAPVPVFAFEPLLLSMRGV